MNIIHACSQQIATTLLEKLSYANISQQTTCWSALQWPAYCPFRTTFQLLNSVFLLHHFSISISINQISASASEQAILDGSSSITHTAVEQILHVLLVSHHQGLKKAGWGRPVPWKEGFLRCSGAFSNECRLANERIFLSAAMK